MSRNVFICNHDSPGPRIVFSQFNNGPEWVGRPGRSTDQGVINNPNKAMKKCVKIGKLGAKSVVMYRKEFTILQPVANHAWTFSDDVLFIKSNTR